MFIVWILSLVLLGLCWVGVLWFGFSETGPKWLPLALFVLGILSAAWFVGYGFAWLVGWADPSLPTDVVWS